MAFFFYHRLLFCNKKRNSMPFDSVLATNNELIMLCSYNYGSSMIFGSSMITPIFKGIDYLEVDCPSYLKMRYISSFELKR